MNPDRISNLQYEVEDKVAYICDKLCRYPREITEQEELDEVCEECPVNAYAKVFISD